MISVPASGDFYPKEGRRSSWCRVPVQRPITNTSKWEWFSRNS